MCRSSSWIDYNYSQVTKDDFSFTAACCYKFIYFIWSATLFAFKVISGIEINNSLEKCTYFKNTALKLWKIRRNLKVISLKMSSY